MAERVEHPRRRAGARVPFPGLLDRERLLPVAAHDDVPDVLLRALLEGQDVPARGERYVLHRGARASATWTARHTRVTRQSETSWPRVDSCSDKGDRGSRAIPGNP